MDVCTRKRPAVSLGFTNSSVAAAKSCKRRHGCTTSTAGLYYAACGGAHPTTDNNQALKDVIVDNAPQQPVSCSKTTRMDPTAHPRPHGTHMGPTANGTGPTQHAATAADSPAAAGLVASRWRDDVRTYVPRGTPNEVVRLNKQIALHAKQGNFDAAMSCFAELTSGARAGVYPTVVTYSSILNSCVRCNRLPHAVQIFEGLDAEVASVCYKALHSTPALPSSPKASNSSPPRHTTFSNALQPITPTFGTSDCTPSKGDCRSDFHLGGHQQSSTAAECYSSRAVDHRLPPPCSSTAKAVRSAEAFDNSVPTCTANAVHYCVLLKGLCNAQLMRAAGKVLALMGKNRIELNSRITNTVLRGCLRTGDLNGAGELCRRYNLRSAWQMCGPSRYEMFDGTSLVILVKLYCNSFRIVEAERLIDLYNDPSVNPSVYIDLATACFCLRLWNRGQQHLLKAAASLKSVPDEQSCGTGGAGNSPKDGAYSKHQKKEQRTRVMELWDVLSEQLESSSAAGSGEGSELHEVGVRTRVDLLEHMNRVYVFTASKSMQRLYPSHSLHHPTSHFRAALASPRRMGAAAAAAIDDSSAAKLMLPVCENTSHLRLNSRASSRAAPPSPESSAVVSSPNAAWVADRDGDSPRAAAGGAPADNANTLALGIVDSLIGIGSLSLLFWDEMHANPQAATTAATGDGATTTATTGGGATTATNGGGATTATTGGGAYFSSSGAGLCDTGRRRRTVSEERLTMRMSKLGRFYLETLDQVPTTGSATNGTAASDTGGALQPDGRPSIPCIDRCINDTCSDNTESMSCGGVLPYDPLPARRWAFNINRMYPRCGEHTPTQQSDIQVDECPNDVSAGIEPLDKSQKQCRALKVELCAGIGDWVVGRARANPTQRWLAVELRHDRSCEIFKKSVMHDLQNLCTIAGDARDALAFVPSAAASEVYVNFPEPPSDVELLAAQKHGTQQQAADDWLCSERLISGVHRILRTGGLYCITTDSEAYCLLLVAALKALPNMFVCGHAGGRYFQTKALDEGSPHRPGSSYFDRLWRNGGRSARYVIKVVKRPSQNP